MVVGVAVLPHHVAVAVNLDHHTALEPFPRRKAVPCLIHHLAAVEHIAVGQQVAVKPRRVGHPPLVSDIPLHVDQVHIAPAGHRGIKHIARACLRRIIRRQPGPPHPPPRLLVNTRHRFTSPNSVMSLKNCPATFLNADRYHSVTESGNPHPC